MLKLTIIEAIEWAGLIERTWRFDPTLAALMASMQDDPAACSAAVDRCVELGRVELAEAIRRRCE